MEFKGAQRVGMPRKRRKMKKRFRETLKTIK
jgi:hypothetical protein